MTIFDGYALNPIPSTVGLNIISAYSSMTKAPYVNVFRPEHPDRYFAIITMSGKGTLHLTNKNVIYVEKGDLLFLNYNELDKFTCLEGSWHHLAYCFQPQGFTPPSGLTQINIDKESNQILQIIRLIRKCSKFSIQHANSLLLTKIICWSELLNKNEAKYPKNITNTLSYINENLSNNIDLKTLAKNNGYCEKQFRTIFVNYLGVTPKQYIIKKRMERACAFLSNTPESIELISETLGFYSTAHFITAFKRFIGITPNEYRKKVHNNTKKKYEQPIINPNQK